MSDVRLPTQSGKSGVLSTCSNLSSLAAFMAYARASAWTAAATAWTTSGLGLYIPVALEVPATIYKMSIINGATINGTIGVAIYDESFNRLTSVAAAAHSGASVVQTFDIADITVMPGIYYLMATMASTTATVQGCAMTALAGRTCGILEQTGITDTPPNPGVPVAYTRAFVPAIFAHYKTTV